MNHETLFEAIRGGDETRIKALLHEDPALYGARAGGVSPVLYACYTGHASLAPILLPVGSALDFGEACALGDFARVQELDAADPSCINTFTADGFPPLGLAIFFRHPELARYLIERGADVQAHAQNPQRVAPIHAAAAVSDRATAALLLERGADVDARQQGGFTALHAAAGNGDTGMVELLLAAEADPSLVTDDGKVAADIARERGHASLADRLQTT